MVCYHYKWFIRVLLALIGNSFIPDRDTEACPGFILGGGGRIMPEERKIFSSPPPLWGRTDKIQCRGVCWRLPPVPFLTAFFIRGKNMLFHVQGGNVPLPCFE